MSFVITTAVVFAAILGVLVFFHELGHLWAAKLSKMRVYEFAFGFGPVLIRLGRRAETDYSIRAVPLGGFVRIAGMDPEEEDVEDGFHSKPAWKRALVIAAGPFMSLALGYVVFLLIGFVWGFATDIPTNKVYMVQKGSPAAAAGIQKGDIIYAIDGRQVSDGRQVTETIRSSNGRELVIQIKRGDKIVVVKAKPRLQELEGKKVWLLGFTPEPVMKRAGVAESVRRGTILTANVVIGIVSTLFSHRITQDVGGIVMIGYVTGEMVKEGAYSVFFELAMLSLMLGVLNLLPIPVLDGGHLLYLLIEKIRGRRLDPQTWQAVQGAGLVFLILIVVAVFFLDISRIASGRLP